MEVVSRIESRPSRRQPWEYVFFVDFAGHPEDPNAAAALEEMREACTYVKVLGALSGAMILVIAGLFIYQGLNSATTLQ